MDLMTDAPEEVHSVARAVPPVKNECANEPGQKAREDRRDGLGHVENRPILKPLIPTNARQHHDTELARFKNRARAYHPGVSGSSRPGRIRSKTKKTKVIP
jgi:hypothetical protein